MTDQNKAILILGVIVIGTDDGTRIVECFCCFLERDPELTLIALVFRWIP